MSSRILHALVLLFSLGLGFSSFAQTQVSGGIFTPTTWTLAESPYIVTGNVVVFPDNSLTIEPGVEVRFQSGTELELRSGSLFANGTAQDPITLTLDSDTPNNDPKWLGIVNTSPQTDSIGIELDHITIEYAEIGVDYGTSFGYRTISNATFQFNDTGTYDGGLGYNWVSVYNSNFFDNTYGMRGRMSAFDCVYENNEIGFADPLYFNGSQAGGEIVNCTFENNDMAFGYLSSIITFARVENSTVLNNNIGTLIYTLEATNSTFENNTEYAVQASKGTTTGCTFRENGIGFVTSIFPSQLNVVGNRFEENTYGLRIDGPGANVSDNIICFNTEYDAILNTPDFVSLTNNCWCTNDEDIIRTHIFDAFDDVNLGIATFIPFTIDCLGNIVFPGDADNNGLATATDILPIGLAYGSTGPARIDDGTSWGGQESPDWTNNFPSGLNYKYSDTNGDGIIDESDVSTLDAHYGQSHENGDPFDPVFESTNVFELYLEAPDTIAPSEMVSVDVMLGFSDLPVNDLYGIAFALTYDGNLVEEGTFGIDLSDSWLGNDLIETSHEFNTDGRFEVGFVRTDQLGQTGFGKIATINFVMGEDIILFQENGGSPNFIMDELELSIDGIVAMTSSGSYLKVENEPLDILITDTDEMVNQPLDIQIYPNPTRDILHIVHSISDMEQIQVLNTQGQILEQWAPQNQISMKNLEDGIYIIRIQTGNGTFVKRILKK